MVKKYIKNLLNKKVISVAEKRDVNGKKYDIITIAKSILANSKEIVTEKGKEVEQKITSMHLCNKNCIKNICRRNNIDIKDVKNLNDTTLLINQYLKKAEKNGKNIFQIIDTGVKNLKNNILESKTLHYIVKVLINKDYDENIIAY